MVFRFRFKKKNDELIGISQDLHEKLKVFKNNQEVNTTKETVTSSLENSFFQTNEEFNKLSKKNRFFKKYEEIYDIFTVSSEEFSTTTQSSISEHECDKEVKNIIRSSTKLSPKKLKFAKSSSVRSFIKISQKYLILSLNF